MVLVAEWARANGCALPAVLTVDHGLRPGSASDAKTVVRAAKTLGLKAQVLTWRGVKPSGNIEAAAREARYALMGAWCRDHGIRTLFVGHTCDDQAETFLIRLARGTGLDGLAAMAPSSSWPVPGFADLVLARPLLNLDREALRKFLVSRGLKWADDPMNADDRFVRSRIRAAWPILEQAGLTKGRIADAALHLARARSALETGTEALLAQASATEATGIVLDPGAIAAAPREIGLRALASVLRSVSGAAYRPRFDRLESLFDAVISGQFRQARTLHGCRVGPAPKAFAKFGPSTVLIVRETGRVKLLAKPSRT